MLHFLTVPSLVLLLSLLAISSTAEARIPRQNARRNFKRQTDTAAHTSRKGGSLELASFDSYRECVDGCGTYFSSLFTSNSALRRSRRSREEAKAGLQDCEWVCSEIHPETFSASLASQQTVVDEAVAFVSPSVSPTGISSSFLHAPY